MKRQITITLIALSLLLSVTIWRTFTSRAASGHTGAGQQVGEPFRVPAIAVGINHNLALKSDGTVVAWGSNGQGQPTIPAALNSGSNSVVAWGRNLEGQTTIPAGLSGMTAIAAGGLHSLALKSDGTVVAWGSNGFGQTDVPAGLSSVTAIAAGDAHNLALKSDGTLIGWGNNFYGQTTIPAGLSGVTAIAAGAFHSLALKSDGTVVAWGDNYAGQTTIPAGLSGVTAIAAGYFHSLALKSDGTVVAWGSNGQGQTDVPAGLSSVTAIAAGFAHSLALKSDGTIVAWGSNFYGQTDVPAGLSSVTAIAAGGSHSLALKSDGTLVAWGLNNQGQTTIPTGLSGMTAIAAGGFHSLALSVVNNTAPTIAPASVTRTAGASASGSVIATVNDAEDGFNALSVTPTPVSGSGVTLNSITIDTVGNVSANIAASCSATTSTFTLQVTDSGNLSATTTLTVTVNPNQPPILSYPSNPGTVYGSAITINPLTGLGDDTGITSVVVQSITPTNPGGISVNSAGVVSVANTVPAGTYTVTIRAHDACGFTDASFTLGIAKATPVLTWNNPANITYGTALSNTQLNATANVAGSFNYSPASGTVLNAGAGQTLAVTFIPTDANNYNTATKSVSLNVLKATPTVTWNNPANLTTCNVPLGAAQLNATANVPGSFVYTPPAGTILGLGSGQTLSVNFTPSNTTNYNNASKTVTINVVDTTAPTLSCPANITVTLPANSTSTAMVVNYPAPTASDSCSTPTITTSKASGTSFPLGTTTVNVTAKDAANNQTSCSFTVTVLYNFSGFFQPVDNAPVVNVVNAGQAIPVKFSLSGNKGLSIFAAGYPLSQSIACNFAGGVDDIEETMTAGASSLSYDAATDRYSYVWKTDKAWKGTCRQLVLKFNDGSTRTVNFQFK